jgi:hypothetical protein
VCVLLEWVCTGYRLTGAGSRSRAYFCAPTVNHSEPFSHTLPFHTHMLHTVLTQLKEKKLKGGTDDSATVVRYSDAVFKPMQGQCAPWSLCV